MTRVLWWTLRAVTFGLLGVVLVLALLLLAVGLGFQRERLRAQAEARIAEAVGGELSIGALEGPLFPSFTLRAVSLSLPDGTRATLDRIHLRYALDRLLLERRVVVELLELGPGELQRGGGATDASRAEPSTGEASPWLPVAIELERVVLRELRLADERGTAALNGRVEGVEVLRVDRVPWPAVLELAIEGRTLDEPPIEARAEIRGDGDSLLLPALSLSARGAELVAAGEVRLRPWLLGSGPATLSLESAISAIDLARFTGEPALETDLAGSARLEATLPIEGGTAALEVDAAAELSGSAAARSVERVELRARVRGGAWTLETARVRGSELELEASGSGEASRVRELELRVRAEDVRALARGFGLELPVAGRLLVDARVEAERLRIADARLTTPAGSLRLAGAADVQGYLLGDGAAQIDLQGQVHDLDLASWSGRPELTSRLTGTAAIAARLPREASQEDRSIDASFDLAGQPGDGVSGVVGRLVARGASWSLHQTRIDGALARVVVSGRGDGVRAQELQLEAALPELAPIGRVLDLPVELSGSATLVAAGSGTVAAPRGELSLEVPELALAGAPVGTLRVRATATDTATERGRLRIDQLELIRGDAAIAADVPAHASLSADGVVLEPLVLRSGELRLQVAGGLQRGRLRDVTVRVDRLLLDALPPLLGATRLAGTLHGSLSVSGAPERPDVAGVVVVEQVAIDEARADRLFVTLSTEHSRLRGQGHVESAERVMAEVRLDLPYTGVAQLGGVFRSPEARLDLQADAFDLALLAPLLPRGISQLTGTLDLRASARGAPGIPELRGSLVVRAASLRSLLLNQTFAPIDVELELANDYARVIDLRIGAGSGTLRAAGAIALDDLRPRGIDLTLHAERFGIARAAVARFDVDGDAIFAGPIHAPTIGGRLTLREARFGVPDARDPLLREIQVVGETRVEGSIREGAGTDPLADARLRLHVDLPRNTWISGRGADLEVMGALDLVKDPGRRAVYTGDLRIVRGTYKMGGRVLQVERGTLALTGDAELDPSIDLLATTRVSDVDISIALGGRLSNPILRLESSPPMEQSDIVALLFLGRRASELDAGQSAGIQGAIAQLGSEFAFDQLKARAGKWLPFDTAGLSSDGSSGTKLQVGRYVGEKVFVRYGRSFGTTAADEVVVEYRMSPSVRIESHTSSTGNAGADVIWSRDY